MSPGDLAGAHGPGTGLHCGVRPPLPPVAARTWECRPSSGEAADPRGRFPRPLGRPRARGGAGALPCPRASPSTSTAHAAHDYGTRPRIRHATTSPVHDEGPVRMDGAFVRRAVAEGFEPSVTCATLAFEASSFGRSDTLPGEILAQGGPCSEIRFRPGSAPAPAGLRRTPVGGPGQRSRKKAVSSRAQSSASTPSTTSGRWLSRRSRTRSQREPVAPAFSSRAP